MELVRPASAQDVQPATGLDNPVLAFNLNGIHDYDTAFQFLDLMKIAEPWIGHEHQPGKGPWGGQTWFDLKAGGYLDAEGWLRAMPPGLDRVGTIFRFTGIPRNETRKAGIYVLRYEGQGTLRLRQDARILSQRPGEIRFENRDGKTFMLDIHETDPEGTGDYIRNITLLREAHLDLFEAGAVFHPDWIARIADARQLRFLWWLKAIRSRVVDWSGMPSAQGAHSGYGQALADMVRLANQVGADPWFTLPYTANDAYVRRFARYVRDNLDPALKAHIEYSNEVWNGSFPARHLMEAQALEAWGVEGAWVDYYVKRATKIMRIWEEEFGSSAEARLVKVLGGQAVNTWLTGLLLETATWRRFEPQAWADPVETFDVFAIASYFGGRETVDPEQRAALLAAIEDPQVDANQYVLNLMRNRQHRGSVPESLSGWQAQARMLRRTGLRLVAYEGGQHLHHSFGVNITDAEKQTLTEFFGDFVNTPEMEILYRDAWEAWVSVGQGPFMQFTETGRSTIWGSWGMRETLDDDPLRAKLLDQLNAQTAPWWEGAEGGPQYQQGITETGTAGPDELIGTPQEDFLIGKAGDDVFRGGPGDDGINGGPGTDRALFSGHAAQYMIRPEGKGYRVDGPDGSDFLIWIEQIAFEETGIGETGRYSLADMEQAADGTLHP